MPRERVRHCLWTIAHNSSVVSILKREDRARLHGVQTCGSVWHCPVCSAKISETRRKELNEALAWARAQATAQAEVIEPEFSRIVPVMMTLTASHKRGDDLRNQLDGMKRAKQKLRQSRSWRNLKDEIAGTITATELTHGSNGWHTHFHELLFVDVGTGTEGHAVAAVELLRAEWLRSLVKVGMTGGKAAFDVQGAEKAGQYIAKWGAAEELTLREHKKGKGRTPFQLLADAKDGDKQAGALFVEYALAFKGRRQLVWSNGFKKLIGIDEIEDEDAADEERDEEVDEMIAQFRAAQWSDMRRRKIDRSELLRAAETGGFDAVAKVVARCMSKPPT